MITKCYFLGSVNVSEFYNKIPFKQMNNYNLKDRVNFWRKIYERKV